MFGSKKSKAEKEAKKKVEHSKKIRAEAMANMQAAREHIGDETLQKINQIMQKMEQQKSAEMQQAQAQIEQTDAHRVADEILWMLEDKN